MRVLIPVPTYGFDPTETAIPWKFLTSAGIQVVFATPEGRRAAADEIMLTGKKLGPWKGLLRAKRNAVAAYRAMEESPEFATPIAYHELDAGEFDGLLLPGGHDKGVREYLESEFLQNLILAFFRNRKPVAAICHGVLLAARSIDPRTGKSILYDYQVTSLLKSQEKLAYGLTRLWLGDYYLTYPETTVEDEVRSFLGNPSQFLRGPLPLCRDTPQAQHRGFCVQDRNFLSARWPGDVHRFVFSFIHMLQSSH